MNTPAEEAQRLGALVEVLVSLVAGDLRARAEVRGDGSVLDGVGTGLNMLADEMKERMVREAEYQRRLIDTERMGAVGQLASAIAHGVNNPSAYLLANLSTLSDDLLAMETLVARLRSGFPLGTAARTALELALVETAADAALLEAREVLADNRIGIERIAAIVRAMQNFTRVETEAPEVVALDDLAAEACGLVQREVSARAELVRVLRPVPPLHCHRSRMVQVVTHLLLNSAQSIPFAARGSSVEVRTEVAGARLRLEVRERSFEEIVPQSPWVFVSVDEVLGHGADLGVIFAAEIVRAHAGSLEVATRAGHGTSFRVEFPLPVRREVPVTSA